MHTHMSWIHLLQIALIYTCYICTYLCIHICICVYMHVLNTLVADRSYIYTYMYMYIFMYTYIYICIYACLEYTCCGSLLTTVHNTCTIHVHVYIACIFMYACIDTGTYLWTILSKPQALLHASSGKVEEFLDTFLENISRCAHVCYILAWCVAVCCRVLQRVVVSCSVICVWSGYG